MLTFLLSFTGKLYCQIPRCQKLSKIFYSQVRIFMSKHSYINLIVVKN